MLVGSRAPPQVIFKRCDTAKTLVGGENGGGWGGGGAVGLPEILSAVLLRQGMRSHDEICCHAFFSFTWVIDGDCLCAHMQSNRRCVTVASMITLSRGGDI